MATKDWKTYVVSICLVMLFSSTSVARTLTLSEAIQVAVANNPNIQAARYRLDAAETRITQARSGYLPQLNFAQSFNQTTNPANAFATRLNQETITVQDFDPNRLNDPDAINNFNSRFALNWSVYNGGQRRAGMDQAKETVQATDLFLKRTEQDIIAKTVTAYVNLLLGIKQVDVIEQALETARANLKIVKSRYDTGFVVKSDLLRAQVRIAELEQDFLQTASQVEVGKAVLRAAMGIPEEEPIDPVSPLKKNSSPPTGTPDQWIETALTERPDLEQMRRQEIVAQKEIRKAWGNHLPGIDLLGQYEVNTENFSDTADNYTVGAVLKWNIYSGSRISARTAEARANLRQLQAIRKNMELGVRVETKEAFLNAGSAWDRIAVAQSAVDQADEALRIVRNRYRSGLLTIVSLLDSEETLQQARTRHFRSIRDYEVSRVRLALAAGTLDSDFK